MRSSEVQFTKFKIRLRICHVTVLTRHHLCTDNMISTIVSKDIRGLEIISWLVSRGPSCSIVLRVYYIAMSLLAISSNSQREQALTLESCSALDLILQILCFATNHNNSESFLFINMRFSKYFCPRMLLYSLSNCQSVWSWICSSFFTLFKLFTSMTLLITIRDASFEKWVSRLHEIILYPVSDMYGIID